MDLLRDDELLTSDEALALMKISRRYLRRLTTEKRLTNYRVGRDTRILRSDAEQFLLQDRRSSREDAVVAPVVEEAARRPGRPRKSLNRG